MNPEWTKKFIELVKTGAPLKAYKKKLGLDKEGIQYHLGRLVEYEAALEAPAEEQRTLKQKVKTGKVHSILETIVKKAPEPEEEMPPIDFPSEVFDILIEEGDDFEDDEDL